MPRHCHYFLFLLFCIVSVDCDWLLIDQQFPRTDKNRVKSPPITISTSEPNGENWVPEIRILQTFQSTHFKVCTANSVLNMLALTNTRHLIISSTFSFKPRQTASANLWPVGLHISGRYLCVMLCVIFRCYLLLTPYVYFIVFNVFSLPV